MNTGLLDPDVLHKKPHRGSSRHCSQGIGTMPSPFQLEDVGGSSDSPPSINKNQQETPRSSPPKKPPKTSKNRQPTAKRAKLSAAGDQQESSRSSPLKRPIETSKKKQLATKRFKPPIVKKMLSVRSLFVRNSQLRFVAFHVVLAHSPRSSPPSPPLLLERSPSPSPLLGNYCLCAHFFNVIV
ncbi:hypothetical protein PVAP13_3KG162900 [Panicum virgatum]|uniref:Uncharacterized protein n=1 Tax=Panicum virgatum TaxID=38727 RepID=A0A8T0UQT4_PANVG|nr:hypothetical protein PVAP13_3KG162900 [Panicum virgatum]